MAYSYDGRAGATELKSIFPSGFPIKTAAVLHAPPSSEEVATKARGGQWQRSEERLSSVTEILPTLPKGPSKAERKAAAATHALPRRLVQVKPAPRDPDIEIMPSLGYLTEKKEGPVSPSLSIQKLPLAQAKAAQDLDKFAERVVTQQLATLQSRILEQPEFAQLEPAAKYPNGKQWEIAARKIAEAQLEARKAADLRRKASETALLSNKMKAESESAVQLSEEAKARAAVLPEKARIGMREAQEELARAKSDVEARMLELAAAEEAWEQIQRRQAEQAAEVKTLLNKVRSKKVELEQLERLVTRIASLKSELEEADVRVAAMQSELKAVRASSDKSKDKVDRMAVLMQQASERARKAAQDYAAAVSAFEMADALVQRELRESQLLTTRAAEKKVEAALLARKWMEISAEAKLAKKREQDSWNEARQYGDKLQAVEDTPKLMPELGIQEAKVAERQAAERQHPRPRQAGAATVRLQIPAVHVVEGIAATETSIKTPSAKPPPRPAVASPSPSLSDMLPSARTQAQVLPSTPPPSPAIRGGAGPPSWKNGELPVSTPPPASFYGVPQMAQPAVRAQERILGEAVPPSATPILAPASQPTEFREGAVRLPQRPAGELASHTLSHSSSTSSIGGSSSSNSAYAEAQVFVAGGEEGVPPQVVASQQLQGAAGAPKQRVEYEGNGGQGAQRRQASQPGVITAEPASNTGRLSAPSNQASGRAESPASPALLSAARQSALPRREVRQASDTSKPLPA